MKAAVEAIYETECNPACDSKGFEQLCMDMEQPLSKKIINMTKKGYATMQRVGLTFFELTCRQS
jgi:hypothetical protein